MSEVVPREYERDAIAYLAGQLGPRAPQVVHFERIFAESPLETEGNTAIVSFDLTTGGSGGAACGSVTDARHYAAVGETSPNYFPAYGLDVEDAYSLHVGTVFMLTMEISKVDNDLEPPGARAALRQIVEQHSPGSRVENDSLAGLFRCEDDFYAVFDVTIDGERMLALGANCPPGFYRRPDLPPQVVLRLHLGKLVRREAQVARGESA